MSLKYSCFLSYQRGNDLLNRFVRELSRALSDELALHTDLPIWLDTLNIVPQDPSEMATADALANSVCMIPVLTPTYFSQDRRYCSREYLGMQMIERQRKELTGRSDSLILPVVLRGANRLPKAIVERRMYMDFSDYLAFGETEFRTERFAKAASKLSEHIADLCNIYNNVDLIAPENFALPSDNEVSAWLNDVGAPAVERYPKLD